MRIAILACLTLAGCTVSVAELDRPYLVARIDSDRSAADFAECSADAMNLVAKNDEGVISITRSNKIGVRVARWDFITTNNGSQAELRSGAEDDAGIELVRACS